MRKSFSLLVLFLLITSLAFAQKGKPIKFSSESESGIAKNVKTFLNYNFSVTYSAPPTGTVPFPPNYYDYVTNGNNQKNIYILGDTIIVCVDRTDSVNATVSNARSIWYQVSYDGGTTWLPNAIECLFNIGSAYGNITPILESGTRTIVITGRQFEGTTRRGSSIQELVFPTGICTGYKVPAAGYDFFAFYLNSTQMAGAYMVPGVAPTGTGDTLRFIKYNYNTNTYTTPVTLAEPPTDIYANARQYVAINPATNRIFVMWWISDGGPNLQSLVYKESQDAGSTWGAKQNIVQKGYIANGDSIAPWFGADVIYRPNTNTPVVAFNTLGFSGGAPNYGTRTGYKLLFWSPAVNSGNPIVIADRTNIPILQTDTAFANIYDIQVGMTAVSHPSLAYSADGSRLFCVYTMIQRDTSTYGGGLEWNFNDIVLSYSDNHGATWSNPLYVTNTPGDDELYPTLSLTGNTTNIIRIYYMSSKFPGCASYSDNSPIGGQNYAVYRAVDINTLQPVGIREIGTGNVPGDFELMQNFPNPFNPATKIQFSLPQSAFVDLNVYDVTGKLISNLIGRKMNPGKYEVAFDGSNLSSGVYFYTLQTDKIRITKKMTLIK